MQRLRLLVLSFFLFLSPTESWSTDSDDTEPTSFSPKSIIKGISETTEKIIDEFNVPSNPVLEQKEWGLNIINDLMDATQEFFELREKEKNAPHQAWFGATKESVGIDISYVLDDLQNLLFEGKTYDFIELKENQEEQIKELNDEISVLKQIKLTLPEKGRTFSKGQDDVQEDINSKLDEIASSENTIREIYQSIIKNYRSIGISLDMNTVKTLTSRIDGMDVIQNAEVFNAIKRLLPLLAELMETNRENLSFSKKYYGVYVLLSEVAVFTQQQSLNKNRFDYLPQLDQITSKVNKELMNIENQILQLGKLEENDISRIKGYENNKRANELTMKTIKVYRDVLIDQQENISEALVESKKDLRLAYSTYNTVENSDELLTLIKNSDEGFEDVIQMQIPVSVPFENELMAEKFEQITMQMKEAY